DRSPADAPPAGMPRPRRARRPGRRLHQRQRIAEARAGVPMTDEHFFDAFHAGREPIASTPGPEEWLAVVPDQESMECAIRRGLACGTLGAGLAAMVMALLSRWRTACQDRPA